MFIFVEYEAVFMWSLKTKRYLSLRFVKAQVLSSLRPSSGNACNCNINLQTLHLMYLFNKYNKYSY